MLFTTLQCLNIAGSTSRVQPRRIECAKRHFRVVATRAEQVNIQLTAGFGGLCTLVFLDGALVLFC
jgi:hypothetical protein